MLSYQHIYHAGNWADVHKHWLLAAFLSYLKQKPKPLTYIETHSGRGLYDLASCEAQKTSEAANAILNAATQRVTSQTVFGATLIATQKMHGQTAYCGSPLLAAKILDDQDHLHFAELHPQEFAHLRKALRTEGNAKAYQRDGFDLVTSLLPPTPKRGVVFVDPSYEIKSDYRTIPKMFKAWQKKWNVGIFALWYPLLRDARHEDMLEQLTALFEDPVRHEVLFIPSRGSHKMVGSGFFISKAPYGFETVTNHVSAFFNALLENKTKET